MLALISFFVLVVCTISHGKDVLLKKPDCGHQIVDSGMEIRRFAQEGEFPWAVLLKYEGTESYKCVGSLISDRYVLTSAVCVTGGFQKLVGVVLGEHNLGQSAHSEEYGIEKITVHADYKKSSQGNHDIALIKLNASVKFSDYIKPICLPSEGNSLLQAGDQIILAGWSKGTVDEPRRTKKVVVRRVITNEECQQLFAAHKVTINDNFLCTHTLNDYKDCTYPGDGGAPIMLKSGDTWYQEGILSFGATSCGSNIPDGNVRVSKYIQWINEKLIEN
ncbi:hypothetical protein RI129_007829 [Pyrocoelia pectoralis]|uniref:Peptidase S1 domain-containing protein n=1 Tax=Pyrocoelia pectoralis TaxID=417401 RepID=A0AAN7VID2_9COLE